MAEKRQPNPWRRVSLGVYLIGFGIFLLLNTTGQLRWSLWLEILPWWPLLLVALGLRLIFNASRWPALVLLSPLLVLGSLGWIATHPPQVEADRIETIAVAGDEFGPPWHLDLELVASDLTLSTGEAGDGILLAGSAATRQPPEIEVLDGQPVPSVRLGSAGLEGRQLFRPEREQWRLVAQEGRAVRLFTLGALIDADLDLARVNVEDSHIEGAFVEAKMRLGRPEETVSVDLQGAFNRLLLLVPPEVPVRVVTEGIGNRVRGRGGDPERKGPGYRILVGGAFNSISVRSDDSIAIRTIL